MRFLSLFLCLAVLGVSASAARSSGTVSLVADFPLGPAAHYGEAKLIAAIQSAGSQVESVKSSATATGDTIIELKMTPRPPAESLAIGKLVVGGKPTWRLDGADDRGLMYALLDVAERIGWSEKSGDLFAHVREVKEQPAIRDRCLSVYTMNRAYWESRFYDESYWTRYFELLSANRFNRFLLIFGYENGGFLAPPYPYFFDTPGFPGVHMLNLTAEQQRRNLAALNRLIELAHAHGITVTLGIWDHIYRAGVQTGGANWVDEYNGRSVPNSVEGVTTENLNAYTLASLQELIARVPAMDGLHFRIHEESGLKRAEMEDFWREVFTHVRKT
ncbi:MAG: hypothetical protein ABIV50_07325, partial [Opitutus sp.]